MAAEDFGIGKGEAQIFKPYESDYPAKLAELRYKERQQKEKDKEARSKGLYGSLSRIKNIDIYDKHQPIFAKKGKDLYDWAQQNSKKIVDEGDVQATMQLQQMIDSFENEALASKNVRTERDKAVQQILQDPNKYREDSLKYLSDFQGYDQNSGTFYTPNPLMIKEKHDWNKAATDLRKILEQETEGKDLEYIDPKSGLKVRSKPNKSDEGLAKSTLLNYINSDPMRIEDANYQLLQAPEEIQNQYQGEGPQYISDKYKHRLMFDKSVISQLPPSDKSDFIFGEGFVETPKYRFTEATYEGEEQKPIAPDVAYSASEKKPSGKEIKEVYIEGKAEGENKPYPFPDPNDPAKTIKARPYSYKTKEGKKVASVIEMTFDEDTGKWMDTDNILEYRQDSKYDYEKANKRIKSITGISYEDYQSKQKGGNLGDERKSKVETEKTLNGVTYQKIGGKWYAK